MRKRKILNFGSINIDYVYHLNDFVKEGETLPCKKLDMLLGRGTSDPPNEF